MALATLSDSPVLTPIARAAERANVDVTLFGSVATRALLFDAAKIECRDLFELAEHVADINLAHTGPASATRLLQAAIADLVPMAPWFRWSIMDRDALTNFDQLRAFNIGVPLRQLRIGTQPVEDSGRTAEVLELALRGEVELFGNEAFGSSSRSGYDTEASAVLLYIDALQDVFDAQRRSDRRVKVSLAPHEAREILDTGLTRLSTLSRDGREAALRRLWYRLSAIGLRMSPKLFERTREVFGLGALLEAMQNEAYPAAAFSVDSTAAIIVSAHLGQRAFRVPLVATDFEGFGDWRALLNSVLARVSERVSPDGQVPEAIELFSGNDVIAAMRSLPVQHRPSSSSILNSPLAQEFIHIGLQAPAGELDHTSPEELTAIVIGHAPQGSLLVPAFASVSTALPFDRSAPTDDLVRPIPERCTIRLNLAGMLDDVEKLDVFLVKGSRE